jgi:hypothetical protein
MTKKKQETSKWNEKKVSDYIALDVGYRKTVGKKTLPAF